MFFCSAHLVAAGHQPGSAQVEGCWARAEGLQRKPFWPREMTAAPLLQLVSPLEGRGPEKIQNNVFIILFCFVLFFKCSDSVLCIGYLTDLLSCLWTLTQPLGTRRGQGRFLPVRQPFLIPLHPLNLLLLTHLYFLPRKDEGYIVHAMMNGWVLLCQKVEAVINKAFCKAFLLLQLCLYSIDVWVCMDTW